MIGQLVGFVRALRDADVRVSLAESLEAAVALDHVAIEDREQVRQAWRAVLVKDAAAFPLFDRLFDRHFPARLDLGKLAVGNEGGQPGGARLGEGRRAVVGAGDTAADSETDRQGSDRRRGEQMEGRGESSPERAAGEDDVQAEKVAGADTDSEDETERRLRALLQQAQEGDGGDESDGPQASEAAAGQEVLLNTTGQWTPDQVEDLYRAVAALAAQLVTRRSRRHRRARRGSLDLRRTLQRGFRRAEMNAELVRRRRKLNKHDLVVLCDISGSVGQAARFFLKLVQEMQDQFSRTRLFLFVDRIAEVTQVLADHTLEDAVARFKDDPAVNFLGRSDYGRALYQFYGGHLDALSPHTVLVVLGDARSNFLEPLDWCLDEMGQRCRSVLWLNPEPLSLWNTEDSVMAVYKPFCDQVMECRDLAQLKAVGERLLEI